MSQPVTDQTPEQIVETIAYVYGPITVDAAAALAQAIRAAREVHIDLLRELEWNGSWVGGAGSCPLCHHHQLLSTKHAPDCKLAAALASGSGNK